MTFFGPYAAHFHLHSIDSSPVQRRFTTTLHGPSREGVVPFNALKKPFSQLPLTRRVIAERGLNWGVPSERGARTASPMADANNGDTQEAASRSGSRPADALDGASTTCATTTAGPARQSAADGGDNLLLKFYL